MYCRMDQEGNVVFGSMWCNSHRWRGQNELPRCLRSSQSLLSYSLFLYSGLERGGEEEGGGEGRRRR